MRRAFATVVDAIYRFLEDDGWAIASYIALSTLMALFPFLILVTALAAFLGSKDLADRAANLLLETWPKEVAGPIAGEVHRVLTTTRGDVLTLSALFSVYFASSGVESLRIGLNRAYGVKETRNWLLLRVESIIYVLVGAIGLLAMTIPIVLGPLLFATALRHAPWLAPLETTFTFVRFAVATGLIAVALFVSHKWLPAGHRSLRDVAAGILATLVLWLVAGTLFGRYLEAFASNYVTYYAGLASVVIALVFLYWSASIFVFGAELNSAIRGPRRPDQASDGSIERG